jgi:hypothetical protein
MPYRLVIQRVLQAVANPAHLRRSVVQRRKPLFALHQVVIGISKAVRAVAAR